MSRGRKRNHSFSHIVREYEIKWQPGEIRRGGSWRCCWCRARRRWSHATAVEREPTTAPLDLTRVLQQRSETCHGG
jgi:hypothetical protein